MKELEIKNSDLTPSPPAKKGIMDKLSIGGECPPNMGWYDYPIAIIAFVLMLLAYAGHAMTYGRDLQRLKNDKESDNPQIKNPDTPIAVIVIAFFAETAAVYYYYKCVMKCQGMKGFLVFTVITAMFTLLATTFIPPAKPPPRNGGRRCVSDNNKMKATTTTTTTANNPPAAAATTV